jgi:acyl-coenzyme A thioesterase 13
MNDATLST